MAAAQQVKRQIRLGFFVMPVGLGLQLLAFMLIASHLGPRDFGVFSVIFAIMNIASFATELGLGTIITKFVAAGDRSPSEHIALALPGISAVALVTSVMQAGAVFAFFPIAETGLAALLAGLNVLLFANSVVLSSALRGLGRMEQWYVGFTLQKVIAVGLVVGVVRPLDAGLTWSVAIWPLSNLVLLVYYLVCVWGDTWRGQLRWSLPDLRALLRESIPVGLISAVYRTSTQLETFLLTGLSGPQSAGLFAVGQRLLNPAGSVVHGAVITPTFPGLCRQAGERRALGERLGRLLEANWLAAMAIALVLWVAAPVFVPLALGKQFTDSVPIVQVVIWALAPAVVSLQLRYAFVALSRQGLFLRLSVLYLAIKLGVIYLLVSRFGLVGASWGTVASECVLALLVWIGLRTVGVPLRVTPLIVGVTAVALVIVRVAWEVGIDHPLSLGLVAAYTLGSLVIFGRRLRGFLRRSPVSPEDPVPVP